MLFLKTLSNVTQNELQATGEKAQDLAFLSQNQMPISSSFVVMSSALDEVIRLNNLKYKIDYMMSHAQPEIRSSLANVYSGVRKALLEAKLPPGLEVELKGLYEHITVPLAVGELTTERPPVRIITSTNKAEDPESNDTVIQNVSSFEELLLGIREAWALTWHPTLLGQRMIEHYPESRLKVALIIQTMEEPDVSCHSYSSLPQDHKRAYLQVYYGHADLRDKIQKDYYAIDKYSLLTVASQVKEQTSVLARTDKELTITPLSKGRSEKLIERDLLEIARLTKKAERLLQAPVKCFFSIRHDNIELLWVNRLGFDVMVAEPVTEIIEQTTTPEAVITTEIRIEPQPDPVIETAEATAPSDFIAAEPATPESIPAEAAVQTIKPQANGAAKLLNASLRIAKQIVERKYRSVFGETDPMTNLADAINRLNSASVFSRPVDGALLLQAEEAARNDSTLTQAEHSKAMEEVAFLMEYS